MIQNDAEYAAAIELLREQHQRLLAKERELVASGLPPDEVKRALDPLRSFQDGLAEELRAFEPAVGIERESTFELDADQKAELLRRMEKVRNGDFVDGDEFLQNLDREK